MAMIGLRYAVAAEFNTHSDGSVPTYKSSSGFVIGGAINANLTKTRNSNGKLYYDDKLGETDMGLVGMNLELGVDDLSEAVLEKMGIFSSVSTGSPSVTTYYEGTGNTTPLGVGYVRVRQKNNVVTYQGVWIYKIQFSMDNENTTTNGENIEWQTPTVNGEAFALNVDNSGEDKFREIQTFTTESACKSWLNSKAGIS